MEEEFKQKNHVPAVVENKDALNIFFCSEEKKDFSDYIKEIDEYFNNKINIIGVFNILEISEKICYYLKIKKNNNITKKLKNIIASDLSLENSEKILKLLIKEFYKNITNDEHPFFVFIKRNKANFKKEELFKRLNNYQKELHLKNNMELDSRNIIFEDENINFKNIIDLIYNYFNESDYVVPEYNNLSYTINFLVTGSRGSGKNALINRILEQKRASSSKFSKNSKVNEYLHSKYHIKLIDTMGFQIGNKYEFENVEDYLKKNNLKNKNIDKKIHFIFYVFS